MLKKLHLVIDVGWSKCCFSSTMKFKHIIVTGVSLIAIIISSCSGPIGNVPPRPLEGEPTNEAPTGLRSGDYAVTRNSIDAILNHPPSSKSENIDAILNNPKKSKKERPGLATGWGEEKTSVMPNAGFSRASQKPSGVDVIYYNDSEGLNAMAPRKDKIDALQTAAGSMVEWGIKGSFGYLPTYKDYGNYWSGHSTNRRYVVGKNNNTYSILVKNRSKSALEIVASVDGLDVQDGKTASYSKRGYVVPAGETIEIKGFRTSESKVAAFKFSTVTNSYANMRHGETTNVGVIGIAVFTQKDVDPWTWMPEEVTKRKSASPFAVAP
jgi:hypothetical protein